METTRCYAYRLELLKFAAAPPRGNAQRERCLARIELRHPDWPPHDPLELWPAQTHG